MQHIFFATFQYETVSKQYFLIYSRRFAGYISSVQMQHIRRYVKLLFYAPMRHVRNDVREHSSMVRWKVRDDLNLQHDMQQIEIIVHSTISKNYDNNADCSRSTWMTPHLSPEATTRFPRNMRYCGPFARTSLNQGVHVYLHRSLETSAKRYT